MELLQHNIPEEGTRVHILNVNKQKQNIRLRQVFLKCVFLQARKRGSRTLLLSGRADP